MFRFIRSSRLGALCAISTTLNTAVAAKGAGFQPGHIVVLQTQSGSSPQAVQLDEYNVVGSQSSPLSTLAIPSTGADKLAGPSGPVKLSADGNYLTFGGYDSIPGVPITSSTPWVVGRVTVGDGTIDLSTKITNIAGSSASRAIPRNAVSSNGSDIWVAGIFGVGYTTLGSSTVTRVNQSIEKNTVGIFGGQLYTSGGITSGVTPPYLIGTVGDGLPKTPTTKEATLPGIPPTNDANATDFWFRDANSLYLNVQTSGTPNPGIQKWTFDGTTWQYQYNLFTFGLNYLSGWVDPNGNTVLFASTGTSILRIVDGGSQALSKSSSLATAPTGTSFFGVAFIAAVPEPASIVLMALGALAVFGEGRWRRVQAARIAAGVLCALTATFITVVAAQGASLQAGDVVAVRTLSSSSTPAIELDEYNSSGLQSMPVNVISNIGSLSNSYYYQGALKLSTDGNYLTLGSSGRVDRVNVNNGVVDRGTIFSSLLTGVASSNGTDIWLSDGSAVYYTTFGSSTLARVSQPPFGSRAAVGIFGGQLYSTTETTNFTSYPIAAEGSGLPKASSPETSLSGISANEKHETLDFWFRDSNTLYLTEAYPSFSHPGVQKWTFDGTSWQYQYNVFTSSIAYLSGWVDPDGNTVLFATSSFPTAGALNSNLLRIVDGGSQALSTSSVLATAATGTSFRGVAFISAPEPASIVLVALGGLAVFGTFRRRKIATTKVRN